VAWERPLQLEHANVVPPFLGDRRTKVREGPGVAELKGVERVDHADRLAIAMTGQIITATTLAWMLWDEVVEMYCQIKG